MRGNPNVGVVRMPELQIARQVRAGRTLCVLRWLPFGTHSETQWASPVVAWVIIPPHDHSHPWEVTTYPTYVPLLLLTAWAMPWLWVNIRAAGQQIRAIRHKVRRWKWRRREERLLDGYGRAG